MRFEKWQALGNDYLIVEASDLSFPLSAEAVRRLCDRHSGLGADGVLELAPADAPGHVARLRIFNPDGSEAELSGNGAREAIMYLRRSGWTDQDQFSIQTEAGEIRPTILGPDTCRVDMGRARLRSEHFPGGGEDGIGEVAGFALPARRDRQPAVRDPDRRRRGARGARPVRDRPADRARRAVPQPHERVVLVPDRARRDPRAHLRARRRRDAVVGHRRVRRGRRVRARRRRLAGDRAARRRRARGRRRRVAARRPDRLGRSRLPRCAERRAARRVARAGGPRARRSATARRSRRRGARRR